MSNKKAMAKNKLQDGCDETYKAWLKADLLEKLFWDQMFTTNQKTKSPKLKYKCICFNKNGKKERESTNKKAKENQWAMDQELTYGR